MNVTRELLDAARRVEAVRLTGFVFPNHLMTYRRVFLPIYPDCETTIAGEMAYRSDLKLLAHELAAQLLADKPEPREETPSDVQQGDSTDANAAKPGKSCKSARGKARTHSRGRLGQAADHASDRGRAR